MSISISNIKISTNSNSFNDKQIISFESNDNIFEISVEIIRGSRFNESLLTNYIETLLNSLNIENCLYLEKRIIKNKIEYFLSKLEIMAIVCNLFNIKEFEEFDDHLLNMDLNCNQLVINYNVYNLKFNIEKIIYSDPIRITYKIYSPRLIMFDGNKLKLLLYISYKQNNLINLKNKLEKVFIINDYGIWLMDTRNFIIGDVKWIGKYTQ